jgi:hypothetical protein
MMIACQLVVKEGQKPEKDEHHQFRRVADGPHRSLGDRLPEHLGIEGDQQEEAVENNQHDG